MKVIKGLAFVLFFAIMLGSCFEPPVFPIEPSITLDKVIFTHHDSSLVLFINFKDGDGDLGLDQNNIGHRIAPYNPQNYFQSNSNGDLVPVTMDYYEVPGKEKVYDYIKVPNAAAGSLITYDVIRSNPKYQDKTMYLCELDTSIFVINTSSKALLGRWSRILDTIPGPGGQLYVVADTMYSERNVNHYNLDVEILYANDDGEFVPYNFAPFCSTFSTRFPMLSNSETPIEGSLQYAMKSKPDLWKARFGSKQLKLRFKIRDRLLHVSNEITTNTFRLESIRQ
jgi:hypothetical protein